MQAYQGLLFLGEYYFAIEFRAGDGSVREQNRPYCVTLKFLF